MPSEFIKSTLSAFLIFGFSALLIGCAVPAGEPLGTSDPVEDIPPPGNPADSGDPNLFNVAIYTHYDVLYVDDLESEFNQRRGIRAMLGFDESDFSTFSEVSWGELRRVDFEGIIDSSVWEQIFSGREDQGLRQQQIFKILLYYHSGTTRYFYAIISKFRGYKDGVKWSMNMTGNTSVEYIEFNP